MGLFNLMTCKNIMTVLTLARKQQIPSRSSLSAFPSPVYHKKGLVLVYLESTRPAKNLTNISFSFAREPKKKGPVLVYLDSTRPVKNPTNLNNSAIIKKIVKCKN